MHHPKSLTLGDLITSAFAACGRRRAGRLVRFALNTRLVTFRAPPRAPLRTPKP